MSKPKPWHYSEGYPPIPTKLRVENRHVGRLHGWAVRKNWNDSRQIILAAHARVGDDLLLLPDGQQKLAQAFNRERYALEDEHILKLTNDSTHLPWTY